MGVREYIFDLITTDEELNDLGIDADSTFLNHTVDTPQVRPLCILRWQAIIPGISGNRENSGSLGGFPVNHRILQVWIHDSRAYGDYARIDRSLKRLRTLLTNIVGVNVGAPDEWLSSIHWEGDSDDLDDDVMGTISRNAQFRLTGSGV